MSKFNFEFNGQKFEINAPTGTTFEQAKAVFDQQTASGGLTGFRVGDVLSPDTQAAAGLASAQSQLTQGLASITGGLGSVQGQLTQSLSSLTGKLPAGVNLNSLTASIGTLGQGAGTQVASALQGGAAAFNSLTTAASGATASISSALSGIGSGPTPGAGIFNSLTTAASGATASISSALAGIGSIPTPSSLTGSLAAAASAIPTPAALTGVLTGAAAQVGSIASKTVGTLSGLVQGTATNGINIADFAKQGPALAGLGNMKLPDVTGTLAQASKLVGQGASAISNTLGAGKFGLDASQLERAGLVKPGTAASFLSLGNNDLVSVLKSPTVWTGKDGVKSLGGLLSNSGLQDKVQQGLMKTGLDSLKSLGVPTDKLTPQALSGLATNAAKSISGAVDWVKNAPGLPADLKSKFDATAVNGAFAVNLAQTKVDEPVLQETKPPAAENTVNNATVEAAGQRIVGNEKVPGVAVADSGAATAKVKISAWATLVSSTVTSIEALEPTIKEYEQASSISQQQWEKLNSEWLAIGATYNARTKVLQQEAFDALQTITNASTKDRYTRAFNLTQDAAVKFITFVKDYRKRIKDLANKIATAGEQL
jgi:hypothetical protein